MQKCRFCKKKSDQPFTICPVCNVNVNNPGLHGDKVKKAYNIISFFSRIIILNGILFFVVGIFGMIPFLIFSLFLFYLGISLRKFKPWTYSAVIVLESIYIIALLIGIIIISFSLPTIIKENNYGILFAKIAGTILGEIFFCVSFYSFFNNADLLLKRANIENENQSEIKSDVKV